MSPFYLVYGRHPILPTSAQLENPVELQNVIEWRNRTLAYYDPWTPLDSTIPIPEDDSSENTTIEDDEVHNSSPSDDDSETIK